MCVCTVSWRTHSHWANSLSKSASKSTLDSLACTGSAESKSHADSEFLLFVRHDCDIAVMYLSMSRAFCIRISWFFCPPTCSPIQYGKQFIPSEKQAGAPSAHMGCTYSIASAAKLCTSLAPLEPNALKASSKLVSVPRPPLAENRLRENRSDMTFTIVVLHFMP